MSEPGGEEFSSKEKELLEGDEPLELRDAFLIGSRLRFLEEAGAHRYPVGGEDERYILGALAKLEIRLRTADTSSAILPQVIGFKEYLEEAYDPEDEISEEDGQQLGQRARSWAEVMMEELEEEKRIRIHNQGTSDMQKIYESPETLFEPEVWEWLDERPKQDVREACRCLAVDAPTATVMLSLRAVEDRLREWYRNEVNESIERLPWGNLLDELEREYRDRKERPGVLSDLDYLKRMRNEVTHPDRDPSWREAEQALHRVRWTIEDIYSEINRN